MVTLNMTTSPTNALQTVNNLTVVNGIPLLFTSVLVFIWIIIFMRSRERSVRYAIAGASLFTSIIGIIFGMLGLIPDFMTGISIAVAILSFIPLVNQ